VVYVQQCHWQPVVYQYPSAIAATGQPVIVTETRYVLAC